VGRYGDGGNDERSATKSLEKGTRHRSFEDFSYGKQSLDGLLFPQRAFFILDCDRQLVRSQRISFSSLAFFRLFFSIFAAHLEG
jgi:hypothetical protein